MYFMCQYNTLVTYSISYQCLTLFLDEEALSPQMSLLMSPLPKVIISPVFIPAAAIAEPSAVNDATALALFVTLLQKGLLLRHPCLYCVFEPFFDFYYHFSQHIMVKMNRHMWFLDKYPLLKKFKPIFL